MGLLHSHLVLLASQEITIQQCMFPRGLCTQEPRINTQKSCLLLTHRTGLARVHCTPAVAGRATVRVNIGWGLVCGTVGPSRPRSPITGWAWGEQVMSEYRVIPGRAGTRSILATWRVLLKRHGEVQVLLFGGHACQNFLLACSSFYPTAAMFRLGPLKPVPPLELQGAIPTVRGQD